MFTLIHGADGGMLAEVDFTAYGPFESIQAAQTAAEEIRGERGLPREATPENNDIWTDAGHWFGIVPARGDALKAFADVVGSRAGYRTIAAAHTAAVEVLAERAARYDRILRAAKREDLSAADLCEIVYAETIEREENR